LEKIYVEAFAKDSYAKHLPFDSNILRKVFQDVDFRFAWGGGANSDTRTYAQIDPQVIRSLFTQNILHELGHCLGLGESLTELMVRKHLGYDLSIWENSANMTYGAFYENLLLEKVGDNTFWNKVYEGSNEKYGEMWDENMPITHRVWLLARELSAMVAGRNLGDPNRTQIANDFEIFAGIDLGNGWILPERARLLQGAMNGNREDEAEVKHFFGLIEEYDRINPGKLKDNTYNYNALFPHARIFDYFKVDSKNQGKVGTLNIGAAQTNGVGKGAEHGHK